MKALTVFIVQSFYKDVSMNLKNMLMLTLAVALFSSLHAQRNQRIVKKIIPGEYVAIVKNSQKNAFMSFFKSTQATMTTKSTQVLNSNQRYSVVRFKSNPVDVRAMMNTGAVRVVGPNFVYLGDPREQNMLGGGKKGGNPSGGAPNDALLAAQEHHQIINSEFAWKRGVGGNPNVIVAVTDDGVELAHPDLAAHIWHNKNEIPNNGIDDDKNGYVDDVKGWDFTSVDNDPNGGSHGTHVAGIIGSQINNEVGGAGTAAGVSLMALRWYGGKKSWTTELIVETYTYAMNNGAKIINTSYNIDWLADDAVYLEMVKLLKENGVLLFNSAGNSGRKNPKRQAIEDVTLVASTYGKLLPEDKLDTRSRFSNYGTGIDIAAPGEKILATCLGGKYCEKSGTSMASPNAAATAAMIWSVYPKLSADQVLHKLFSSTDNIDERNKEYKGLLGAGRINIAKAIAPNFLPASVRLTGLNKDRGELVYQVYGRLDKRSIPKFIEIMINGNSVIAEVLYSRNSLRLRVSSHLQAGEYNVAINPSLLMDVFGRPVRLADARIRKFNIR